MSKGIIYEYEDGGRYCGEWENDHAHGYGVCTGPQGAGLFEGTWEQGQQISGVYTWPSGQKYMGKWRQGLREGTGKETKPDGTEYSGEFTADSRGPFGVLTLANGAVYSGNWANGVQEGEGVETYTDGGVYRGQYKNGLRHGYGTRSSAAYELHGSASSPWGKQNSGPTPSLTVTASTMSLPATVSVRKRQQKETSSADSSAQLYEGEWRDDKRHGHGVLKIPNCYTYYGGWGSNTRSGYGVMVYSNGRKEEGQWQSGKLVAVLKRKKLPMSLHKHSLESKVKQAHTLALQAADRARNKAMLAESRAQVAGTKARSTLRTAQQSLADAKAARERADVYKGAPRISESLKSPIHDGPMEFPALDQKQMEAKIRGSTSLDLLTVQRDLKTSSSCQNILDAMSEAERTNSDASLSSLSVEDSLTQEVVGGDQGRVDSGDSELRQRRSHFSRHSSQGSSKSSVDTESFDSVDFAVGYMPEKLKRKRQQLLEMGTASGTDPSILEPPEIRLPRRSSDSNVRSKRFPPLGSRRWSSVEDLEEEEEEAEDEGGIVMERNRRGSGRKRSVQRVDETTGEIGEASDEEAQLGDKLGLGGQRSHRKLLPPPPNPLEKKASITMDMLTQMANWNRMITYLNFALLLFLLVLILIFVMTMNYYYIVSHTGVPQNPASFMAPVA